MRTKTLLRNLVTAAAFVGTSVGGFALLYAPGCGSSSSSDASAGSGGGGGAGGGGGGGGGSTKATNDSYADCTGMFMDMTGKTAVDITFGVSALVYEPKCIKIKAGTMVTWTGDFKMHPLNAASSNTIKEIPVPMPAVMKVSATFMTPGFHGYYCLMHGTDPGGGMAGNIQVVQ